MKEPRDFVWLQKSAFRNKNKEHGRERERACTFNQNSINSYRSCLLYEREGEWKNQERTHWFFIDIYPFHAQSIASVFKPIRAVYSISLLHTFTHRSNPHFSFALCVCVIHENLSKNHCFLNSVVIKHLSWIQNSCLLNTISTQSTFYDERTTDSTGRKETRFHRAPRFTSCWVEFEPIER